MLSVLMIAGIPFSALAAKEKEFTVVIDAGHGGHDHGAIDNGAREKEINLSVALKLGELIKKKLKDTKVVYTRDDDTFVSLQGRADIANKAKGDLFISIHTNSVDAKNKNRKTVAGASVYTQGAHKDDANLAVARRENSVIELENGYEQKYSGFDPNKVESYIIFEMAAKQNLAQSHRFAKSVQNNLVKVAGRKDRGVHQAGFWVLWATSMPSVLVELDFICNPESASYLTSKQGVDKLAEAIFDAVKEYEQNFRQKQRMMSENSGNRKNESETNETVSTFADAIHAGVGTSREVEATQERESQNLVAVSRAPESEQKDLSHSNLELTRTQTRARHAADGRRRRSSASAASSAARNISVNHIEVREEESGDLAYAEPEIFEDTETVVEMPVESNVADKKKDSKKKAKSTADKKKDTRKWVAQVNQSAKGSADKKSGKISSEFIAAKDKGKAAANDSKHSSKNANSTSKTQTSSREHAGARKSLKNKN